jgi:hypothetical protein
LPPDEEALSICAIALDIVVVRIGILFPLFQNIGIILQKGSIAESLLPTYTKIHLVFVVDLFYETVLLSL